MKLRALCAALIAATSLGACATSPEPCTRAWVEYRTDRILSRFAGENRGLVSDLRQLIRADADVDPVQAILLAAKADDLRRFANSFDRIVIPELQSAVGQCGNNPDFIPAFTEFLRREGVPETALQWVGPIMAVSQVVQSQQ
ncbi:MAG: hypothetical protein WEA77_07170 [Hyphomonas sp.]|uniref:hypothetical protein n=1 Tax=Hyphomonas sp. TaxID=87 RepID=UPI0034A0A681